MRPPAWQDAGAVMFSSSRFAVGGLALVTLGAPRQEVLGGWARPPVTSLRRRRCLVYQLCRAAPTAWSATVADVSPRGRDGGLSFRSPV